jgi:leader peptidase (prepilin peptidase)/N-methyltransferase
MPLLLQGAAFFLALLGASICDLQKREIPPVFPAIIAIAGLINLSPASLFGIALCLPFLIAARRNEHSMGGGDIKLVAACGFLLGLPAGMSGLVIGLTMQLLVYGAARLFRIRHGRAVPLAPCLSIGFFAAYIIFITVIGGIK